MVNGCTSVWYVDIVFSYGRALMVCWFLQEVSKVKESNLHEIWNVDTAFLLCGADFIIIQSFLRILQCSIICVGAVHVNEG